MHKIFTETEDLTVPQTVRKNLKQRLLEITSFAVLATAMTATTIMVTISTTPIVMSEERTTVRTDLAL